MLINSESKILAMMKERWKLYISFTGCREKKFEGRKIEDAIDQEKNE